MSEEPEKLPVTVQFGGFDCDVYRTSYPAGGATALYLTDRLDGGHVATATVNVPEANTALGIGAILVKDYGENSGMMAALEEAGIAADTGRRVPTGFTEAKVARLLL